MMPELESPIGRVAVPDHPGFRGETAGRPWLVLDSEQQFKCLVQLGTGHAYHLA